MSPGLNGVPAKSKKQQDRQSKGGSFMSTLPPRPTATVSPNLVKETSSSRPKDTGPEATTRNPGYNKPEGILPGGKQEGTDKLTNFYDEESRRAPLSLLSSMMLPGAGGCDSARLQSLENTTLSSYVKLLSLVRCLLTRRPNDALHLTQEVISALSMHSRRAPKKSSKKSQASSVFL